MRPALFDGAWDVPEGFNFGGDVVEAIALEDPERRAITFVDPIGAIRRLTFHDVALGASRWSRVLHELGLSRGDRLLVLLGKTPDWHMVLLGALRIGVISVPCSEQLRAKDLAFRARNSGAELLIASRSAEIEVRGMEELLESPLPVLYIEDVADTIPEQRPLGCQSTHSSDVAFILYTSGTTRDPKGVTHTHAYTFAKRVEAEYWLDARPGDLVWCTAGTGWAKSIWNSLLGPWSCGAEIVLHEGGFDPEERFGLLERLGVTILCQAPTEYRLMAKLDDIERYDLSRLRHAVSAGEPLNPEAIARFEQSFGLTIHDGYGQTETTLIVANLPGDEIRPGSMGHPTPGHTVAVIDERGEEVPPGVEGDVALRGRPPSLFAGYWLAPEETDAAFRGEWYVTGDRATRDEDGYFWFTGRADDVIVSAAYRIGPFEVESALLEHPAVAESAVVGKPDPERGQIVKAFVVLRPGLVPSDELAAELQEHCKRVTAPYKYPREIAFVPDLPKTRSGKIRRSELRRIEGHLGRSSLPPRVEEAEPDPVDVAPVLPPPEPEPEPLAEPEDVPLPPEPEPMSEPVFTFEPWPEPPSTPKESIAPEPAAREPVAAEPPQPEPEPEPQPAWEPAAAAESEPESEPEPEPEPEPEEKPEPKRERKPAPAASPQSPLVARLRAYERRPDEPPPSDPLFSLSRHAHDESDDDHDPSE
jgi:acyl-coenzyme A synthetase/AMP-(fatty) acid ligase